MTSLRLSAAFLVIAATSLAPLPAAAQSAKDIAAARQAFREGEEAEAKSDYPTALARFQAALAIKETPQLHLRVGAVEEKLGKLRDALASYQRGLDKAGSLPAVAKVAREQIAALGPRIPTVTVTVAKPVPGIVVTLDGTALSPADLGTAVPLDPGAHRLHAEAPGYLPRDEAWTSAERGRQSITVDLAPAAPVEDPAKARNRLAGGISVGAGAAALVAGSVLIGVSVAKDASIDKLCGGSDRLACPESKRKQILGDVSAVNAMRFSGIGVGVLGVAGAAVGTVLLVKAGAPPAATGAVRVVPLLGAGTAGVGVVGRF